MLEGDLVTRHCAGVVAKVNNLAASAGSIFEAIATAAGERAGVYRPCVLINKRMFEVINVNMPPESDALSISSAA